MPRDYHSSRVESYFISAQREIFRNTIVDIAYVGNRADGTLLFANFNQARPNAPGENLSIQARRPIQEFADITYAWNGGKSRYDGFQARVETRGRGLYFLNALTLSRTKDNGSGSLENANGNSPTPQDINNLDAEYALSGYHQPYNMTNSVVWELPFGRDRKFLSDASTLTDAIAGGWQVSFVSIFTAGDPVTFVYTPTAQAQVSNIVADFRGANNYRPNLIGDPIGDRDSTTSYFNRAAFAVPDPTQPFGNAGPQHRARPGLLAGRLRAAEALPVAGRPEHADRSPRRSIQSVQPRELPSAGGELLRRQLRQLHHDVRSAHHPARSSRQLLIHVAFSRRSTKRSSVRENSVEM